MNRTPSGLLLPGSARRGLTIHVPRGYETGEVAPTMICRVPTGPGTICGRAFYPGEESAWNTHVGNCARANIAAVHEQSPKKRVPIMHDENEWDPEVSEHMRNVGRRMLAEGRLVVKPSERAGF